MGDPDTPQGSIRHGSRSKSHTQACADQCLVKFRQYPQVLMGDRGLGDLTRNERWPSPPLAPSPHLSQCRVPLALRPDSGSPQTAGSLPAPGERPGADIPLVARRGRPCAETAGTSISRRTPGVPACLKQDKDPGDFSGVREGRRGSCLSSPRQWGKKFGSQRIEEGNGYLPSSEPLGGKKSRP